MIDAVTVPEGSRGPWTVQRFTITRRESAHSAARSCFDPLRRSFIKEGTYTKLIHNQRGVIMSDSTDERTDHREFVITAKGHVLINGLGIGMCLAAVLKKPDVTRVTVIEIDPDLVALVGPHYTTDPRVEIITADAYEYAPPKGTVYDVVWHDIWDDICADNLPEMTKLKRKYGRISNWQGCWCEADCRLARARWSKAL